MSVKITTREYEPLQKEFYEEWLSLYHQYAGFYEVSVTKEGVDRLWGWLFDKNHPLRCFVAKREGGDGEIKLDGFVHVRAMPSPLRGCDIGFVDDLFVVERARGNNVAEALMRRSFVHAKEQGWPLVRWLTREKNTRARKFYNRIAKETDWKVYEADSEKIAKEFS